MSPTKKGQRETPTRVAPGIPKPKKFWVPKIGSTPFQDPQGRDARRNPQGGAFQDPQGRDRQEGHIRAPGPAFRDP